MPRKPSPHVSLDFDALMAVSECLDAERAADPVLAEARIGELLRLVPGRRAVIEGQWRGRAVVFRVALGGPHGVMLQEWREMCRAWPDLCDGRYRIAQPLHCSGTGRLLVLERVAGRPLMKQLRRQGAQARGPLVRQAGEWLRRYTDGTESWRAAQPQGWVARAERAAARQPFARLRRIETGIATELHRLASLIRGSEWRTAICHGDFHPANLILGQDRLTGIDTGGSGRMAVTRDLARFLMHLSRRGLTLSGDRWLGVDRAAVDIMTEVFALTENERRLHLPFMLGCDALLRVETRGLEPRRVARAADAYGALLADLQGLQRA